MNSFSLSPFQSGFKVNDKIQYFFQLTLQVALNIHARLLLLRLIMSFKLTDFHHVVNFNIETVLFDFKIYLSAFYF